MLPRLWALALALAAISQSVSAQTWSARRERPALFEIIGVDATSQSNWPFGREDIAGDGASKVEPDEAAIDLRSLYADPRMNTLWLRAYVASTSMPPAAAVAFFFIDTDGRANEGGPAESAALWAKFDDDPSPGGYEVAVGLRGDGTSVGVYLWSEGMGAWMRQPDSPRLATLETGTDLDPLRIAGDEHGYFQIFIDLPTIGLDDEACVQTPIFVRLWNDVTGNRSFGDDADVAQCKPRLNKYGDPAVLQSASCEDDDACPARGQCRMGTCVFAYDCSEDTHCRAGERCESNMCVRTVDESCDDASDCDGLVCASGECTTCRDSGARACSEGQVCTPNGSCIRPSDADEDGAAGSDGPKVRGGAFTCSASTSDGGATFVWFVLGLLAFLGVRRRGDR